MRETIVSVTAPAELTALPETNISKRKSAEISVESLINPYTCLTHTHEQVRVNPTRGAPHEENLRN